MILLLEQLFTVIDMEIATDINVSSTDEYGHQNVMLPIFSAGNDGNMTCCAKI